MQRALDEVSQLLLQWRNGDRSAFNRLMPLVYGELHKIAKRYMARQIEGGTLQTTAIIHEAYIKLREETDKRFENRAHFFGVAAMAMRHILVDRARHKLSARRRGESRSVRLIEEIAVAPGQEPELITLDDALTALATLHPRQAKIIELRYFGGLSVEETAEFLQVSPETVARDWRFARAFLRVQIRRKTSR